MTSRYIPEYKRLELEPMLFKDKNQTESSISEKDINQVDFSSVERNVSINSSIIDNNENIIIEPSVMNNENFLKQEKNSFLSLKENEYCLFVKNTIVFIGSLKDIEEQINLLLFDEHPDFNFNIKIDDLMVIKRVSLKVGAFLNE